ncbi:MAG: F0F1 ATP synthase subunit epsilon [Bacteroidales bacterium]|nr:F0F1 ATP synthase subunit epsilon [Bacteroidales bacterium]
MEYSDIILDIISPERTLVHESVGSVELPGTVGRFEVLKDHAPLVSSLACGDIVYKMGEDKEGRVRISSGFVEICANHVIACVEL